MIFVVQYLRKKGDDNLNWSQFWLENSLFTKRHAYYYYQPNVASLYHRHVFSYFREQGIVYSLHKDFNFDGGFQAYWTRSFELVKEKRPGDFGE